MDQPALLVEKVLRLVVTHPGFQHLQLTGFGSDVAQRDLVRSPEAFQIVSIHFPRRRPALGAAENDHWPAWPESFSSTPRLLLELTDLQDTLLEGSGHGLVHAGRVTAFNKIRCVPVADEERLELLMTDASKERGVIDLVAIEVQDRQHGAVGDRVEELVAVPASGEGTSLGLPVTHHN